VKIADYLPELDRRTGIPSETMSRIKAVVARGFS